MTEPDQRTRVLPVVAASVFCMLPANNISVAMRFVWIRSSKERTIERRDGYKDGGYDTPY